MEKWGNGGNDELCIEFCGGCWVFLRCCDKNLKWYPKLLRIGTGEEDVTK